MFNWFKKLFKDKNDNTAKIEEKSDEVKRQALDKIRKNTQLSSNDISLNGVSKIK